MKSEFNKQRHPSFINIFINNFTGEIIDKYEKSRLDRHFKYFVASRGYAVRYSKFSEIEKLWKKYQVLGL